MDLSTFTPFFKEKEGENNQFYYENGQWIQCDECIINSLWGKWICTQGAKNSIDDEGFLIFYLPK